MPACRTAAASRASANATISPFIAQKTSVYCAKCARVRLFSVVVQMDLSSVVGDTENVLCVVKGLLAVESRKETAVLALVSSKVR